MRSSCKEIKLESFYWGKTDFCSVIWIIQCLAYYFTSNCPLSLFYALCIMVAVVGCISRVCKQADSRAREKANGSTFLAPCRDINTH